jgi:hypothetical protein
MEVCTKTGSFIQRAGRGRAPDTPPHTNIAPRVIKMRTVALRGGSNTSVSATRTVEKGGSVAEGT